LVDRISCRVSVNCQESERDVYQNLSCVEFPINNAKMLCVHEAYERIALRDPKRVAALDSATKKCATYKELVDIGKRICEKLPSSGQTIVLITKRSAEVLACFVGASMAGCPLLPLPVWEEAEASGQKRDQWERNIHYVLKETGAPLIVTTDSVELETLGLANVQLVSLEDFLKSNAKDKRNKGSDSRIALQLLSGGSTGNPKLYSISRKMVLSELGNYPLTVSNVKAKPFRVLQQSPAVWPASMFGQINIALAFGGTIVFEQSKDSKMIARTIRELDIQIVGGAPSQLVSVVDNLGPESKNPLIMYTWGEALKTNMRSHLLASVPEANVIELLVATEYWLCMYGCEGKYRTVPNCTVEIMDCDVNGIGQLGLSGPMVLDNQLVTQDLVRRSEDGLIEFVGRQDFMTKIGGNWFNVSDIETNITSNSLEFFPRILDAVVCGDQLVLSVEPDVFPCDTREWLQKVKQIVSYSCPVDLGIRMTVNPFPKTAAGKIDRRAIVSMLEKSKRPEHVALDKAWNRFSSELGSQAKWALAFAIACGKYAPLAPYMYLATLYIPRMSYLPKQWTYSAFSAGTHALVDFFRRDFPFGIAGLIVLVIRLRKKFSLAKKVLLAWSLLGIFFAFRANRGFAWMFAFWSAAGVNVRDEGCQWLTMRKWKRGLDDIVFFFKSIPDALFWTTLCRRKPTSRLFNDAAEKAFSPGQEESDDDITVVDFDEETRSEKYESVKEETVMKPEDEWWEKKPVDYITFRTEGGRDKSSSPSAEPIMLGGASSDEEFIDACIGQYVEKGGSLRGLSSLRITEFVQALRVRVPSVSATLIMNCTDIDDLRTVLLNESRNSLARSDTNGGKTGSVRIQFLPGQVNRPCRWMFRSKQRIDRERLRSALVKLEIKHPLLRSQLADPKHLHSFLYDGAVMVANLQGFLKYKKQMWTGYLVSRAVKYFAKAVHAAWARIHIYEPGKTPDYWIDILTESAVDDFDHLRRSIFTLRRDSEDVWNTLQRPLTAHLFKLPEGTEFLLISVKHSVSDGNSAFPLTDDLAYFYENPQATNPVIVDPIPELEKRLEQGLIVDRVNPNRTSMRTQLFYSRTVDDIGGGYYRHYICFENSAIKELRQVSSSAIETGFDSVLLSVIAISLMRTDKSSRETMTLYCPLRDGVNESAMIGLLADWRDLSIDAISGSTVLDVVFDISEKIRKREWEPTLSSGGPESVLLNWLPFDGKRRLADQSWEPYHLDKITQRWNKMTTRDFDLNETPSGRFRSMSLEQYDTDGDWWLRFDVAMKIYPPEWMMRFGENINRTFTDILNNPIVPALP
jgi:acyl-CoA synthetase (AMP-forming)/AMP-acid ligase II